MYDDSVTIVRTDLYTSIYSTKRKISTVPNRTTGAHKHDEKQAIIHC